MKIFLNNCRVDSSIIAFNRKSDGFVQLTCSGIDAEIYPNAEREQDRASDLTGVVGLLRASFSVLFGRLRLARKSTNQRGCFNFMSSFSSTAFLISKS